MRPLLLSACLFLLLAGLAPRNAFATNVLLPDEASTSESSPNLGLGIQPQKDSSSPTPSSPEAVLPTSQPAASSSGGTADTLPLSQADKNKSDTQKGHDMATALILRSIEAKKSTGGFASYQKVLKDIRAKEQYYDERLKPTFMEDTPDTAPDDALLDDASNKLTVKVMPRYLWGPEDVRRLHRVFGYDPKEIQKNCMLRLDGRVMTDKERGYRLSIYAGAQGTFRYRGTAQSLEFFPRAVCNKPQKALPHSGETIRVNGDKYVISLMKQARCSLKNAAMSYIELTYAGDGDTKCK